MMKGIKWTREEDKLFEEAVVLYSEEDIEDEKWRKIGSHVPGRSLDELQYHYEELVHDVDLIDSGRVDPPSYSDELVTQISFQKKHTTCSDLERKRGTPWTEEEHSPLFVTWNKVINGGEPRLRGCIGTLGPRPLVTGFRDYALTSALRDHRFPPIEANELPQLQCTVSILTDFETAIDYLHWEVGKHGIIIDFIDPDCNQRRNATYLPEVAEHEGWTQLEAIDSLIRKAEFNGVITESLRKSIRLTRYQSSAITMHYGEYVAFVTNIRGTAPAINGVKLNV